MFAVLYRWQIVPGREEQTGGNGSPGPSADHGEREGLRLMSDATAHFEQLTTDVVVDLLDEPSTG